VTILRGTRVKVTGTTPILFQVDGEPHPGGLAVEARLQPGALRVKVR
jgi:diacylglycerol kinase family enzyme